MGSVTRWLDVEVGTDDIDLNTLPCNLALLDLYNDGEIKLLVGDLGRGDEGPKLKVFRGAMQLSDMSLPDLPLGVAGFYCHETVPRSLPTIAIAFGSCVCFYRNMKLFYTYYLPVPDLNVSEMNIWKQLSNTENHSAESVNQLVEDLKAIPEKSLSLQSRNFISMTFDQQLEFLEQMPSPPEKKVPEIACIATLKMNSEDKHGVSCVVVGSEDGEVIVLDPNTFTQLSQVKIDRVKKIPYQMITTGMYNVDYRITIATREKCVCLLKRGWPEGRIIFSTDEHIIAIEVTLADNSILAICADNTLSCYTKKGKKQWCLPLDHRPISLTLLPVLHLGMTLVGVALASGHVHLYDGKARRDTLFVRDVASVMKFGQLGQEEHVFIIVTASGDLMLKILKRTADFDSHSAGIDLVANSIAQKPWLIPKKSKLFLEQSVRERDNAIAMHETFQQELIRMRLLAAKTFLEAHVKSDNSMAVGALEPVRLSAEVEGLGPVFRVTLIIENTSSEKAIIGLSILFHVHATDYKISNPFIKVPLLSPGAKLKFPTKVEEIFSESINPEVFFRSVSGQGGERSLVKVLLLKERQARPVLAATVQMPPTDPMMLPLHKIQDSAFLQD